MLVVGLSRVGVVGHMASIDHTDTYTRTNVEGTTTHKKKYKEYHDNIKRDMFHHILCEILVEYVHKIQFQPPFKAIYPLLLISVCV